MKLTEINLTYILLLYCCVFTSSLVFKTGEWSLEPSSPWVLVGASTSFQLLSNTVEAVKSCSATSPLKRDFKLDGNSDENEFNVSPGSPDRLKLTKDASRGCSAQLSAVSNISEGIWYLTADTRDTPEPSSHTASANVHIIEPPTPSKTVVAKVGSSVTLDCGSSSSVKPSFCRLLNTSNLLHSFQCSFLLDPVREEHLGQWTCIMAVPGSMTELRHTINLVVKAREHVESKVVEKGNKIQLFCALRNSITSFSWCRAISPTGTTLLLTPGLINGRYSALSTNVKGSICSLEIDLPLEHPDYGQWRLDLGISPDDFTGCFLKLPNNSVSDTLPVLPEAKTEHVVVSRGGNLQLKCSVPWAASYCYVQQPDGSLLRGIGEPIVRLLRAGICSVSVKNITLAQAGLWTCGLASNNGTEDVLFHTLVDVASQELSVVNETLEPVIGATVNLLCKSLSRRPLNYCRFTSPKGHGYSFTPNMSTDSRLSYWGAGLEEGECGLQIRGIQKQDVGNWTCATTFNSYSSEEYATITIRSLRPTEAFTIGMSFGAVIIASAMIALATIGYRRRRRNRLREEDRSHSLSPSIGSADNPISRPDIPLYGGSEASNAPIHRIFNRAN